LRGSGQSRELQQAPAVADAALWRRGGAH
jgi:hypothetical protein